MLDFFASQSSVYILIAVIGVLGYVMIMCQTKKRNEWLKNIFERQAQKYNGTVEMGGPSSRPRLRVRAGDIEAEVFIERISTYSSRRVQYYTTISAPCHASWDYKIHIYREQRIMGIGTVFGQDIKIGHPEFDEAFVIQGTDETVVRQLLTTEIQAIFLRLKDCNPRLEIRDHEFRIRIPRLLQDEQQYDALIDSGLVMIKKIAEIG